MVGIGGGTADGAEVAARKLVADGATALVSFGLSGGLDPQMESGRLLVAKEIVCLDGTRYPTDLDLALQLGGTTRHVVLASNRVVVKSRNKRLLWQSTGAAAVDLESGAVARVAAEHGFPIAVLRAICDPANRSLPPAALESLSRTGKIRIGSVLASLMEEPFQLPALFSLAMDAAAARRALVRRVEELRRGADLDQALGKSDQPA
jgi:adenosylhomocysteine nucleosidase